MGYTIQVAYAWPFSKWVRDCVKAQPARPPPQLNPFIIPVRHPLTQLIYHVDPNLSLIGFATLRPNPKVPGCIWAVGELLGRTWMATATSKQRPCFTKYRRAPDEILLRGKRDGYERFFRRLKNTALPPFSLAVEQRSSLCRLRNCLTSCFWRVYLPVGLTSNSSPLRGTQPWGHVMILRSAQNDYIFSN